MTLTEFLLARIAEDEAVAHEATHYNWRVTDDPLGYHVEHDKQEPMGRVVMRAGSDMGVDGKPDAAHIARHDPARALREAQAKRRLVGDEWFEDPETMRILAEVYSDHPDYRDEWRWP